MGKTAGPIPYSYTRLNTLQTCLKQYYYIYVNRIPELEIWTPNLAKGTFLHRMAELSWTKDKKTHEIRQKYKSRDSFVNFAEYYFSRYIGGKNSYRGIRIGWEYPKQDWQFFYKEAKDILGVFYHTSQGEGPPLATEVPIKVKINGRDIVVGAIDVIMKKKTGLGLRIRDHKYYPRGLSDMQKNFDPQLTMYDVFLTSDLASYGPISRNYLHLDIDEAKQIAGDLFLSPNIELQYHLLHDNGRIINVTRTTQHYFDFQRTLELNRFKLEYAKSTGNFARERGHHCEYCPIKDRCSRETLEEKTQFLLIPNIESMDIDPFFVKKKVENLIPISFPRRKKV